MERAGVKVDEKTQSLQFYAFTSTVQEALGYEEKLDRFLSKMNKKKNLQLGIYYTMLSHAPYVMNPTEPVEVYIL